jgi:uncharacterized protein
MWLNSPNNPTSVIMSKDYFKRVVELQKSFAGTKTITNSLQTNGTLLTDEWCSFLRRNRFMVGISLDGPRKIHDRYRRDRAGKGTFDQVLRGLRLLQKHKVEYNVLASVSDKTGLDRILFFSDAVMAIAITLLVIDLRVPEMTRWLSEARLGPTLLELWPGYLGYLLSFFIIGNPYEGRDDLTATARFIGGFRRRGF